MRPRSREQLQKFADQQKRWEDAKPTYKAEDGRPGRRWTSSARSRRRCVRGRHRHRHVGRAGLGPADPGLRGPGGRREGRRRDARSTSPSRRIIGAKDLADKAATFDLKITAVKTAGETKIDDDAGHVARPQGPRSAQGAAQGPDRAGAQRPHPHAHEAQAARPARRGP